MTMATKVGGWKQDAADKWMDPITCDKADADKYDSTSPNFLKK